MTDNEKAVQILSNTICSTVSQKLATASFDVTVQGVIIEALSNNYYSVNINGNIYKIKSNLTLNTHDIVYVMLPQNNASNMFIVGTNTITNPELLTSVNSVNGKVGTVILNISDIPNLSSLLNNKLETSNIIQGNNITIDTNNNDITISANDVNFEYSQVTPAMEWNINHNLNKYPSVTVMDTAKTQILASVTYIDKNNLKINFSVAISGIATLN